MCIKIYKLDPAKFLSAPGLGCQVADLKRTKVKLDLLTDIDVINGRKRYKRNMSLNLLICKS